MAAQHTHACPFKKQALSQPNLQWTAKKTDLIELLYTLDAAGCFNNGNASLNQIATCFENVFNTDLSHFPRDFYEMRIRNDQTPFMDKLKKLFGKLYGDKGYISAALYELLFEDGLHWVTGIKNNMKNRPMTVRDKILLRKRSVIETINDELKNICEIEYSRHRSPLNFLINLFAGLATYGFFSKKPAIKFERSLTTGQLELFH